jgi:hypothetical protein
MPDNYAEGHPLRKDFPLRGRFSRAEQTRRALAQAVEDHYTPEELAIGRHEPRERGTAGRGNGAPGSGRAARYAAAADAPDDYGLGAAGSAAGGAPAPGGSGQ